MDKRMVHEKRKEKNTVILRKGIVIESNEQIYNILVFPTTDDVKNVWNESY